jgi:[acyl-carrier-protein] S-malonyltransferase
MNESKTAAVFPGQGAQRPGMGKDFFDQLPICRSTFEEASAALDFNVAAMCFGEDERLNLTEYTQPCILATEIAMLRGLRERYGFSPVYFGGHSLGEFTALVAADVMPFTQALQIVQIRGRLMQKAVPVGVGAMAAVIGEGIDGEALRTMLTDLALDVANLNSANQVVISGEAGAMPAAEDKLRAAFGAVKAFRFVPLNVSAPFHSRFMHGIEEPFRKALETTSGTWRPEHAATVTSNYTGGFHRGAAPDVIDALVRQLSNPVRWIDNMQCLAAHAGEIYEVGPGRPLRDFFKTAGVTCTSITTFSAAERHFHPEQE